MLSYLGQTFISLTVEALHWVPICWLSYLVRMQWSKCLKKSCAEESDQQPLTDCYQEW